MKSIYPENKEFIEVTYKMVASHISISKEGMDAMIESYERNLIPFYEAVDTMVNGVKTTTPPASDT